MRYCSETVLRPLREAPVDQGFVIAQLGQSLDGRIATPTGKSRTINGTQALDHLHRLRAAVDAVIVGVGTVLADDPQLNVRRVGGKNPARVVIDPNARMPDTAQILHCDAAPTMVVRREGAPRAQCETIYVASRSPQGTLAPSTILAALQAVGLNRCLLEGGAHTIAGFLAAGMVDRLHILQAPIILGSGRVGLDLPPIDTVDEALRPEVTPYLFDDGDVLFDCDLRTSG